MDVVDASPLVTSTFSLPVQFVWCLEIKLEILEYVAIRILIWVQLLSAYHMLLHEVMVTHSSHLLFLFLPTLERLVFGCWVQGLKDLWTTLMASCHQSSGTLRVFIILTMDHSLHNTCWYWTLSISASGLVIFLHSKIDLILRFFGVHDDHLVEFVNSQNRIVRLY